jgi:hypothetical protein
MAIARRNEKKACFGDRAYVGDGGGHVWGIGIEGHPCAGERGRGRVMRDCRSNAERGETTILPDHHNAFAIQQQL